ncbi:tyrosine-type recombinase/integrase [Butyrivibrio sp. AE2015]|uniref:tyrosine-type recombinase/integrase n=1 Tax=Butyrivibrio sp. AE2015 TaxID=1280663 RepID=UPI0003B58EC3|nr:tyrosine-type recombinase/integrase [Butyrivibrio sp. AE2015]
MDKLSKDQIQLKKANGIIDDQMPEFARRFFADKKHSLKASSYYAYALELKEFFDYLGSSFNKENMKISDLDKITPEVIEDFVEYLRCATVNGKPKVSSNMTLKRKLCALSSFFDYYFQKGFIGYNPLLKVNRPAVSQIPSPGSDMNDNLKLLDFVSQGNLPSEEMIKYQNKLRSRDTAILSLIMGAGVKTSECVELNIQDLDLEHNCITIRSRREPSRISISSYIADVLSKYLVERLEIITFYGHDDALFLSLQKKRLGVRSIELLLKKYSSILFGDDHSIKATDMRNAFRTNVFTTSRNLFITSEMTGNTATTLLRTYTPFLECFEAEKGKDFDPSNLQGGPK